MNEVKYARPEELRALADLIDTQNEVARGLERAGSVIFVDNVQVTDKDGNTLGVLSWRTEADSFGLALG
jgi:hypothetical protein